MSPFLTALIPKEPDLLPLREKMAEHSRVAWELGERFPSLPNPSWVNNHAFFLWPGQNRAASQETSRDRGASWRPRWPLPIARLLSRLSFSQEFWRLYPYVSSEQSWHLIWEVGKGKGICGNWNQAEQKFKHIRTSFEPAEVSCEKRYQGEAREGMYRTEAPVLHCPCSRQ